jgi:uncharacterized protein (DUF2249 family)
VSAVIARDESLVDVFVSLAPAFERLRNPGMRKVMTRLVTVEQAARMAGVDADELVTRLNAHASGAPVTTADASAVAVAQSAPAPADTRPDALVRVPAQRIVHVDVRDELRKGREPFSTIMAALRTVPAGGALTVRAIFEPVPLYAVMKQQGLAHWTESFAPDDWRVWFYPSPPSHAATDVAGSDTSPHSADAGENVIVLDVRGLEPPEPMTRTLTALEQLPLDATLLQINVRVPQFLLPLLQGRGFTYDVREQEPGLVRVSIRHGSTTQSE